MKFSMAQRRGASVVLVLFSVGFFALTANAFFSYQTNQANANYNVEQSLVQTANGDLPQASVSLSWAVEARERANQRVREMVGFGTGGLLCLGLSGWFFKSRRAF